jgi:hypothetical protein
MRQAPTQIWKITTRRGQPRYFYYSTAAARAIPLPAAEAELLIATERSRLVDKPSWVGK